MNDRPLKAEGVVNSSFSTLNPHLQLAWDSHSLGLLKECPRKYQLSIVEGWSAKRTSVHLLFGLYYHSALETYDHARAKGATHKEAITSACRRALQDTWDSSRGRPWSSDDKNKNRWTLIRSVVWYLDHFADDPAETVILADGKPAVELSFRFATDYHSMNDEPFIVCGHLDRLVNFQENTYVLDRKTTKSTITPDFFQKFSPDNQMSIYSIASRVVFGIAAEGIIIDGAQVAVTFSRFERGFSTRTDDQLAEFYADMGFWIGQAEIMANRHYWPMNDKSCGNYGGCDFRGVCSKSPASRDRWLQAGFTRRVWDPLQVRGDI